MASEEAPRLICGSLLSYVQISHILYVVQIGEIQNAFLMYFCYLRYGFGAYFKQVITYSDAFALREKCATPILKQVIINHL